MISINVAFASVLDVRRDLSDIDDTLKIKAANYINQMFYEVWYNSDPEKFITTTEISVVDGTDSYDLPADFRTINTNQCGIFPKNQDTGEPLDDQLALTGYGSQLYGYYLAGTQAVFTPKPSQDFTYKFRYIPILAQLTDVGDNMIFLTHHLEIVRDALLVWYDVNDEDYGREGIDDQRFARIRARFVDQIYQKPNIMSLPSLDRSY